MTERVVEYVRLTDKGYRAAEDADEHLHSAREVWRHNGCRIIRDMTPLDTKNMFVQVAFTPSLLAELFDGDYITRKGLPEISLTDAGKEALSNSTLEKYCRSMRGDDSRLTDIIAAECLLQVLPDPGEYIPAADAMREADPENFCLIDTVLDDLIGREYIDAKYSQGVKSAAKKWEGPASQGRCKVPAVGPASYFCVAHRGKSEPGRGVLHRRVV